MGIDYSATIIVGLPRKEFTDKKKLNWFINNEHLLVCAPYYDGDDDDNAVVGLELTESRRYSASELIWDQEEVERLKARFKEITGMEAKVWLSPHGW